MKTYKLPKKPGALIFDIDSTLYTNKNYVAEQHDLLFAILAKHLGVSLAIATRAYDSVQRSSIDDGAGELSMGNAFAKLGLSIEDNMDARLETFVPERHLSKDIVLRSAIEKLSRRFRLSALTNNPKRIGIRTLEVLGIRDLFEIVIGADTYMESKPSLKPYTHIRDQTGVGFDRMISVGDRYDVDIAYPVSLGCGGILVSHVEEVYTLPDII